MSDLWWPKFVRKPRLKLRRPRFGELRLPSKWIIFVIILVVYYFVVSGGMFVLSYETPPFIEIGGRAFPVYPGLNRQVLIEGIVGGALFFLGFAGFYLMYQSTRNIYRPRYAQMMLGIGLVMILISFFGCQWLITVKLTLLQG